MLLLHWRPCPRRIIASMTEEQLNRYESCRRSALPRPKMRKASGPACAALTGKKGGGGAA